ncbi:MAG: integrase arm-type DNA-binding domain-containing protein [Arcobacter sp.]|jgi:integrase|uniref:tyrosine-type recombinase/integrase n=1 Tax=Arcobacter sp. TaxID=1872629 RepID=UPI002A74A948|nr:integrase arm-type DNA-binding domain-containing protein [Arcobacter sp.]MDY3204225.1 integrase arm-type DNA-binding domain-containing protein [Arcobacter sp.]
MMKKIDKKNELTDLKIKHLKPTIRIEKDGSEKLVVNQISDTKIKGLYLTVKPNNNKLWEFRYTSPTKKNRRRTSFGNYPDVSLLKAREIGQKYRELLANNIDPIDNKKEELKLIDLNTKGKIKNAINEWLKKESLSTTETTHKSKKMVFNYVLEFFRKENIIYVNEIKLIDITKLLQEKEKTAPETASKLFNYIGNFFKFCVLKGYCEQNIIANIRKKDILVKKEVTHMPKITDLKILRNLIRAIYTNEEGSVSVQNALKLVLHLPLRPENLANLKWDYIDFENKILLIPRNMMKVKNKNLPDFSLPLTDKALEILLNQKALNEKLFVFSEYIFIGKKLTSPINKESTNKALKRLGFNDESKGEKLRTHGFRGIFRSMIDTLDYKNNFSFEVKERVLDHYEENKVARAYNHKSDYSRQLKELMTFWSDFIYDLYKG